MGIQPCAICGEPVDDNEMDPCGHFDTDDVPCTVCGKVPDDHDWGEDAEHEYSSGI